MQIIDLTHIINSHLPTLPGDEKTQLKQVNQIEDDGFSNFRLTIGMHSGTHIDGPYHMLQNAKRLVDFNPDRFIGKGVIINCRENKINLPFINKNDLKDSISLLYTGFSQHYYETDYFINYPIIDPELIDFLINSEVKAIGMDTPSPDYSPYLQHRKLMSAEILIIENLTNLDQLLHIGEFEIIAMPLKIESDSAPARVIAILKQPTI